MIFSDYETMIGFNDVKSIGGVYFYVILGPEFENASTVIPYDHEKLNAGGAMNLTTGVFRAPANGVYLFTFYAMLKYTNVQLRVNGVNVADWNWGQVFSEVLTLQKGDRVDTYLDYGVLDGCSYVNPCESSGGITKESTRFSGILLEETLSYL